jgi:hypothetical protein
MERFPTEFCFQFTNKEFEYWKSQIVISNNKAMGLRKLPYAFTEQGVAMLAGILRSDITVYHFGASLKDLGKKWFAFSKYDKEAFELLNKVQNEIKDHNLQS